MSPEWNRPHRSLAVLALGVGMFDAATATADARDLTVVACRAGDPLPEGAPIPVAPGAFTTVRLPGTVAAADVGSGVVNAAHGADTLAIQPSPGAVPGAATTLDVTGPDFGTFSLPVSIVDDIGSNPTQWRVIPRGQFQADQDADNAQRRIEIDAAVAAARLAFEAEHQAEIREYRDEQGRALIDPTITALTPAVGKARSSAGGVRVRIIKAEWKKSGFHFDVELENPFDQPYRASELVVFDADDVAHTPIVTHITRYESSDPSYIAEIAPHRRTRVAVMIPGAADHRFSSARIEVSDILGLGVGWFAVDQWGPPVYLKPMTAEQLEDERREKEQRREKERKEAARMREAQRLSIHVLASYGAIWLAEGIDDDRFKPANLKGLGVRVTKGVTPLWAFEAEIAGATSGIAEYGTVTVAGNQGDLIRSANLGRAQAGGMIRFGDRVVPHVRAGLGLQVVSEDARLMTASGELPVSDTGMDVGMSIYVGAGLDARLGANWVAGIGFSFTESDQRVLDIGINLAYRWNASPR